MNKNFIPIFLIVSLFAEDILTPFAKVKLDGIPQDLVLNKNNFIVANDEGAIQSYNYKTKRIKKIASLEKIKDFTGEYIYPNISSLDYLDGNHLITGVTIN